MTAILELAAVSTFTCTAASTLGLTGYAHFKPCIEGYFKKVPRHQQKNHPLEPPHHDKLLAGPLRHKGVQVTLNGSSVGKRPIEFNGEILFMGSSAGGALQPTLSLGACDVKVTGAKVVAAPPSLPTVGLTFTNQEEAQQWSKEFMETALVGPPQDRIQELITHSMRVEKHIADLRSRSEKVSELEKQNKKLKKDLKLVKCGFGDNDNAAPKQGTSSMLASWLMSGQNNSAEQQKLNDELKVRHAEMESANRKLRERMAEQARSNNPTMERWRNLVNQKILRQKELEEMRGSLPSTSDPASAQCSYRDPKLEPAEQSFAIGRAFSARKSGSARSGPESDSNKDVLTQEFEQWFMNVESRLEYCRQSFLEEKCRADYTGALVQTPAPENVGAAMNIRQQSKLDYFGTLPDTRFQSLGERIRSHQTQVSQDCDVLQQTLKAQLV